MATTFDNLSAGDVIVEVTQVSPEMPLASCVNA